MPDYMSKRSKEEKDKSARLVAKTLKTTTPTHGKPGSWGKEPGTFEEEALEPELEIVAVVEEEAIPEMIKEVLEETVIEANPEAELGKEIERVRAEAKTALDAGKNVVIDGVLVNKEEPPTRVATEEPLEAEPEPVIEAVVTILNEKTLAPDKTREAEIEALKAKLAELEK